MLLLSMFKFSSSSSQNTSFQKDIDDFILDCTKDGGSFSVEDWHKEWLAPSMEDVMKEKGGKFLY